MSLGFWFGQPIEDLNKDELLKVVEFLAIDNKKMRDERESLGDGYYDLLVKKELNI